MSKLNRTTAIAIGVSLTPIIVLVWLRIASEMFNSHSNLGLVGIALLIAATIAAVIYGANAFLKDGKQKEQIDNEHE